MGDGGGGVGGGIMAMMVDDGEGKRNDMQLSIKKRGWDETDVT